jgi:protein-L-isoaspartate(D-aspartate) O-methyltransferase
VTPSERDKVALAAMIMRVRSRGLDDPRMLRAIEAVPRRFFVPARDKDEAYADRAVPIECGQTLTAPSVMAQVLRALDPAPGQQILDIGCGSGYQAAVLATFGARVVTLERYRTLVDLAEDRFTALKLPVSVVAADGLEGFSRHAPYDRIVVNGAVARVPAALMDQLGDRGVLVAPVGTGLSQTLVRIVRDGRLYNRTEIGTVRFVPLVEGLASRL